MIPLCIVDQDYNFTDTFVPSMKINETTGKLLPVSFYIGSTFVDNVFEGAERFAIRLSSTPTEILQVGDDPNAYITIRDATCKYNIQWPKSFFYR